jgi:predicted transcriptional regulator
VDRAIGFDEFRWLQELTYKTQKAQMPGSIGAMLLTRGLIARKADGFELTAKGRIALAKLA